MRRLRLVIWLLLFAVFGATVFLWNRSATTGKPVVINNTPVPPVPTLDPARVGQGAALYAQYCARCHGAELEGAPDHALQREAWRALLSSQPGILISGFLTDLSQITALIHPLGVGKHNPGRPACSPA